MTLPHPEGGRPLPDPDSLFKHPIIRAIDSLLATQPATMNDIFRELRERGYETDDTGPARREPETLACCGGAEAGRHPVALPATSGESRSGGRAHAGPPHRYESEDER